MFDLQSIFHKQHSFKNSTQQKSLYHNVDTMELQSAVCEWLTISILQFT